MTTTLPAVTLRPLSADDAAALVDFYNHLSPASIRTFCPLGASTTLDACQKIVTDANKPNAPRYDLGAWDGDTLIGWGFVCALDTDRPDFGLAVADAHQGQGLGKALIDGVIAAARARGAQRMYLIAVQDNTRAIGLYTSRGFVPYGEMIGEWDKLPYVKMIAEF
jgi:GNAT superfamily N-acetyltransferase